MYHRSYLSFFSWEPMVISDKGSLILGKPPTDGQSWSFPEVGLPQIIHVHRIFHGKPTISIIGVPPCIKTFISIKMVASPLYLHISPLFTIHFTIWLFNIAGWKIPTINGGPQLGKSSISMGHGFHGYVSHNQRVTMVHGGYKQL